MKELLQANRWKALATAAALMSFASALLITSGNGPGLDPDSMAYVGAASSFAHGDGLRVPMGKWEGRDSSVALTVWPPAFPLAMSVPQMLGASPLTSARIVIALAAAATGALIVLMLGGTVGLFAAAAGVAVTAVTTSFVVVHLSVLSEPLFLSAMLLTLYGMVSRRPWLAAAGAVAAVMTRYAGISAGAAAAIWFVLFAGGFTRDRIRRATIAAGPAAFAFILWMIHNSRVALVQSPIKIAYHPGLWATVRDGFGTLATVAAPGASAPLGFAALVVLAVLLGFSIARPKRAATLDEARGRVALAASVMLVSYLGMIVASRMFVGGSIEFDARILSPAILLAEIVIVTIVGSSPRINSRSLRIAIGAAAVLWLAASLRWDFALVSDSIEDGNDFAASDWRESSMMEWIRDSAGQRTIYTNWPAAVYFDAHRNPFDIPTTADADSLQLFGKKVRESHGALAAFNTRNFDYPAIDSIAEGAGLVEMRKFEDGVVWEARPGQLQQQRQLNGTPVSGLSAASRGSSTR